MFSLLVHPLRAPKLISLWDLVASALYGSSCRYPVLTAIAATQSYAPQAVLTLATFVLLVFLVVTLFLWF